MQRSLPEGIEPVNCNCSCVFIQTEISIACSNTIPQPILLETQFRKMSSVGGFVLDAEEWNKT